MTLSQRLARKMELSVIDQRIKEQQERLKDRVVTAEPIKVDNVRSVQIKIDFMKLWQSGTDPVAAVNAELQAAGKWLLAEYKKFVHLIG